MSELDNRSEARGKAMDVWSSKTLCLCLINENGEVQAATPATLRLLGRDNPGQSLPSLASFVHPEDRIEFQGYLNKINASDHEIPPSNFRLVVSQGQIISVEFEGEKFDNGTESFLLLNLLEREPPSERTIIGADEWDSFQATAEPMIESMVEGAFIVDMSGRIIMVNHALLELLGVRGYKLISMPVGILFATDKQGIEKATVSFGRIMKYGKAKDLTVELVNSSGEKIPASYTASVIRSQGNELLGVLAVVKDMRGNQFVKELEKKNVELENAYAELKGLDEMKDDLLSLVGHELRAPLSNILGYSEFLQEEALSKQETVEFSSIIYQESHRLSRLVNDILDLSRMERGKLVYNYFKGNLNDVVKRSLLAVESALREKGIRVEKSLDENIQLMEFDPDRIQQVVVNILDNAIKFSDPGKNIEIATKARTGEALLSIADQGIGIPQEHAEKVFNKFEQIEDLRKHSRGSGLGMPIARMIIEEGHDGKLWFESPGKGMGTTFYFTLPKMDRV